MQQVVLSRVNGECAKRERGPQAPHQQYQRMPSCTGLAVSFGAGLQGTEMVEGAGACTPCGARRGSLAPGISLNAVRWMMGQDGATRTNAGRLRALLSTFGGHFQDLRQDNARHHDAAISTNYCPCAYRLTCTTPVQGMQMLGRHTP